MLVNILDSFYNKADVVYLRAFLVTDNNSSGVEGFSPEILLAVGVLATAGEGRRAPPGELK